MNAQEKALLRIGVRAPGSTGYIATATVTLNGQPATYAVTDYCYTYEAPVGEVLAVEVQLPGAATAQFTITADHHGNSIERYDVQLGPEGSLYLRSGFTFKAVQPDDSRIGIVKPGQINEDWKKAPELQALLDSLGLVVDVGYGVTTDVITKSISKITVPFLIVKRKDDRPFAASSALIYHQLNERGYQPGVFLMKGQLSICTLPISLELASSSYYDMVIASFETLGVKTQTPSKSSRISIQADYELANAASWVELINRLSEIKGVKSVTPTQYTYHSIGL